MATQVTPEVKTNAEEGSFTVVELEEGTQITNTSNQKNVKHSVSGDSVVDGAKMTNGTVVSKTAAGESNDVSVNTKSFKGGLLRSTGQGSTNFSLEGTKFVNSAAKHGNSDDSISFKNTTVRNAKTQMGAGDDTVTFGAGTQFSGKTKVNLGKGGTDVVEFDSAPQNGKVIVNKFDENDTLIVGGESFSREDIEAGKAAEFTNIKINFA